MGRISQGQARQAPAVRCMGGHPQSAPGSSHHTSCRAFLCFTEQCCKARSWRTMVLPLPSGHLLILDLLCHCPQPSSTEHLTSCSLKLVVKEVSGQLNDTRASNWPHKKHRGRVVSSACQLWKSQMPLLFRNSSKKKEQTQTFSI